MRKRFGVGAMAVAVTAALLLWLTVAGSPSSLLSQQAGMQELMSAGASKTVTFSNDRGQPIGKEAFIAAMKQGQPYSYTFNGNGHESSVDGLVVSREAKTSVAFTLGTEHGEAGTAGKGLAR